METVSALGILILVLLLQLKHSVCDGPLQTQWMVSEKGIYGRTGGLAHAGLQGLGSVLALFLFGMPAWYTLVLAAADFTIHYHIDFYKESLVRRMGWTPRDNYFWWTLAADQTLHHLTYIAMAAAVVLHSN